MKRIVLAVLFFAAGTGAGYALALFSPPRLNFQLGSLTPIRDTDLGCKSPAYAAIFEDIDRKSVQAYAVAGTDEAAIKIDRANKEIVFMTGAGVRLGITEAERYPILFSNENTLLAAKVEPLGALNAILIKTNTGHVMWTKVAHAFLLSGQATFFECR